uniref:Endopolygalacturonase 1 n=1 Tax=Lygus hesperus TaxID=30085 RepID=A0A0A9YRF1_LYGHE
MTAYLYYLGGVILFIAAASAVDVSSLDDLQAAKARGDRLITLRNIEVPAGKSLDLSDFEPGTKIEIAGKITFGLAEWGGPLVLMKGQALTIEGKGGSIDAQGSRWWDNQGAKGKKKPLTVSMQLEDSKVIGLLVKNPPLVAIAVNKARNLEITKATIDVKEGNGKGALDTKGVTIRSSTNTKVLDSTIDNQSDCLLVDRDVNQVVFERNTCNGGNGVIIIGGGGEIVRDIQIKHSKIIGSNTGVSIKPAKNGKGLQGIILDSIELKDIKTAGIWVSQQAAGSSIRDVTVNRVEGNVLPTGTNMIVNVPLDPNNQNWNWFSKIWGGKKSICKGIPKWCNIKCL